MINKEVMQKLFQGAYTQYKDQIDHEDFSFYVAQDVVTLLWDIDLSLADQLELLNKFHAVQGDMIDTLSFFIKYDPTRLEGEAQIFTNKLNKVLKEATQ